MSNPPATLNVTPSQRFEVFRGAPLPIPLRRKFNGVYLAFDATLICEVKPRSIAAFTLTVGAGITLSAYNAVANAQAIIQLSEAQSLLVDPGEYTTYVVKEGPALGHTPVLRGTLVGAQ
jgi:hypothetical protein